MLEQLIAITNSFSDSAITAFDITGVQPLKEPSGKTRVVYTLRRDEPFIYLQHIHRYLEGFSRELIIGDKGIKLKEESKERYGFNSEEIDKVLKENNISDVVADDLLRVMESDRQIDFIDNVCNESDLSPDDIAYLVITGGRIGYVVWINIKGILYICGNTGTHGISEIRDNIAKFMNDHDIEGISGNLKAVYDRR